MKLHGVLAATLVSFSRTLSRVMLAEDTAQQPGLLQALDPRVRVAGVLMLVIAVAMAHNLVALAFAFLLATLLALVSRVSVVTLMKRVWLVVLAFTGLIALPALFLTPGARIQGVAGQMLPITRQGLQSAALLILRVETAVTLTTTLVLSTQWAHVLKALRAFHIPREAVMMLSMAHRYVFLLVETASQMFEARTSRTVGALAAPEQRHMMTRTAGVLMSKSMDLSQEVFLAMQSRGYRGEVRLVSEFHMRALDWFAMTAFAATALMLVWFGR